MMRIFREYKITGWRRHFSLSFSTTGTKIIQPTKQRKTGIFRVRPDFVFPKLKLAVFVDGCFWHGCPVHSSHPKTNSIFWQKKLTANKVRDQLVTRVLKKNRWRVLRIWEHDISTKLRFRLVMRIYKSISG
ncbi:MAG: hypothetical protein JXA71_00990 [Chitinispirillaceae bacterium]|nr:hypothetical protein [Chitinispirillaceae bacterium]